MTHESAVLRAGEIASAVHTYADGVIDVTLPGTRTRLDVLPAGGIDCGKSSMTCVPTASTPSFVFAFTLTNPASIPSASAR